MMNIGTDVKDGIKPVVTDPAQEEGETAPRTSGVLLQARELTIRAGAGENLLSDISFHIEPGDLVALTGLSRSGKSILLRSLAGLLEPESGEILIDGVGLYTNLKAFRSTIGFVPAEFALPQNLTVEEILQDAAMLRLPRRVTSRDRKQRVLTLLQAVGLTQLTNRRVGSLSNFEKRKLSIAVELISYPGLLLVDGSAEALAPFEEVQIIILLRELSRQGITIIQVNERSRSVGLADKIIFLAPGGLLAWFGPADETFAYLKGLLPRGVVKDLFGLQEALEILVNPQSRDGIEWAKRFKDHSAYQKYVDDPLHNRYPDLLLQTRPLLRIRLRNSSKEKLPPPIIPRASGLRKLILLIRRNARLAWRDKTTFRMLAIPLLLALVTFGLSATTILGPVAGETTRSPAAFGLLMFIVVLTAAFLVQNEIFKERAVYQREHRTSPMLLPYVLSKVWSVGILAIYQGLIWTGVLFLVVIGRTINFEALRYYGITFCLVALIGGILGLIVSALSRTAIPSPGWLLLLTVPQVVFILSPLGQWSGLAIVSLCLFVALVGIQSGAGSLRT
jgi:ABC-type multidrug transport system ATPase subunit